MWRTGRLACKEAEITEQTYYRWRKEYGGLQVDQARRLKEYIQVFHCESSSLMTVLKECRKCSANPLSGLYIRAAVSEYS